MKKTLITAALITSITGTLLFSMSNEATARDQIRAVGSSTVYPFTTVVAEEFGKSSGFKTPIVESTGTGGGFKLFCGGVGEGFPDISNASRAIKPSEKESCMENGVTEITEIKIGFDGIVIANSKQSPKFSLTKEQIFLALAKKVPHQGQLVDNTYKTWNEIDAKLPAEPIEVYGPPPTSGTRDAFVELVMEGVCLEQPLFMQSFPDKEARKNACHLIREDGKYIEAGENDNLLIQKLKSNVHALGIFGYSFLEQNMDSIQGSLVGGIEPTFENITSGSYQISRPLFVYVKNAHLKSVQGLKEFVKELTSDKAMGQEGYLAEKGLVPLKPEELKQVQEKVKPIL